MASWDVNRVKAQLRLTAQRLGQLQDKMEAQGQITRRDIATLLQQSNFVLARAKAQKVIREDIYGDLLQTLEMQVGIVLEHIGQFQRRRTPSPVVVEAASSIIFAAPRVDSTDLQIVREMLMQQLGPDFSRAASDMNSGYVSARVLRAISAPPPSANTLDRFLYTVARSHNVQWVPDLQPHEKVDAISSMLDPSSILEIDLTRLRALCSHGLPEYPPWLRPRVWRLLLGTLPLKKAAWNDDARKQRDNYYELLRRLLEPFDSLPPPSQPLAPLDASLMEASQALTHVPHDLFAKLVEEPDKSDSCPLDETAPDNIRVACAAFLDARLRLIRESENDGAPSQPDFPEIRVDATPEIRLEISDEGPPPVAQANDHDHENLSDGGGTPEISLSTPESPSSSAGPPTTLLRSRSSTATGAHPRHLSALLRLLFIHWTLNPANRSPLVASLLVPLYSALAEEIEPADAPHVEADVFWLFEAMVSEFAELEEPEGANMWMRKIGERLQSADTELAEDLQLKGLDPVMPHYSYRWLTTLLTHTLPLSDVLTIWDAIFSCPARERGSNPKLDYLIDICTSMLLCARSSLVRLGRPPMRLMLSDENPLVGTPLGERELEEAFAQGMLLLQSYPLRDAGGVDRVIQLAYDISKQRERLAQAPTTAAAAVGFAQRWRNTYWKPAASAPAPPTTVPEAHEGDDSDDDSTGSESDYGDPEPEPEEKDLPPPPPAPAGPTLGSRLAQTVWKGITNQSAMEPPPSPMSPGFSPQQQAAPLPPTPDSPALSQASLDDASSSAGGSKRGSGIWAYAEKLRDSDTAATLAKVSTNWRVKALDAWSKRSSVVPQSAPPTTTTISSSSLSPAWTPSPVNRGSLQVAPAPKVYDTKRSSLPEGDRHDAYSPPARPAFFHPVRDSIMPDANAIREMMHSPTGSELSARSERSFDSMKGRRESMSPSSATRVGGPRPLLLSSSSLITHSRAPTMDTQFSDAVRAKRPHVAHRSSQSSISSASPSEHASVVGHPPVPDTIPSRVIPLNRKTPSPMARTRRQESLSSVSSPSGSMRRLPMDTSPESDGPQSAGRRRSADTTDNTTLANSPPPPPGTPPSAINGSVHVVSSETQRGSVVLSEFGEMAPSFADDATPKSHRKTNASLSRLQVDDSSDSSATPQVSIPSRVSRVRSKRYPPRLANLRQRADSKGAVIDRTPSPNTLAAPEPPEDSDATTPKAANFEVSTSPSGRRVRKLSNEGRTRKISNDGSTHSRRKVSSERRETKHKRDSSAVEGDDEGYDELLSAYESEDSMATS